LDTHEKQPGVPIPELGQFLDEAATFGQSAGHCGDKAGTIHALDGHDQLRHVGGSGS
jgi:hypothetical protein